MVCRQAHPVSRIKLAKILVLRDFQRNFLFPVIFKRSTRTRLNAIKLVQISFKSGFIAQNSPEDKHAGSEIQQNTVINCTVCSEKIRMPKTPMYCCDNIRSKARATAQTIVLYIILIAVSSSRCIVKRRRESWPHPPSPEQIRYLQKMVYSFMLFPSPLWDSELLSRFCNYRSGMVNSNMANSKFHLIQSFFEIFARFLSFHV